MALKFILHKQIIEELNVYNLLPEQVGKQFKLNPRINYTSGVPALGKPSVSVLTIEIGNMDDGTPIYIKLKLRGIFVTIKGADDETLPDAAEFRIASFPQIYSYARTLIASVTMMGGLSPFILPDIDPKALTPLQ